MFQDVVRTFINVLDHAREFLLVNEHWQITIMKLKMVLASKDVNRLKAYCDKNDERFDPERDYTVCTDWKYSLRYRGYHDHHCQRNYYLAYKQFNAYLAWLDLHPTQKGSFNEFMVSSIYFVLYVIFRFIFC